MAFNINNFLTNMTGDGYRPNLFTVEFTFPLALTNLTATRNVSFKAKATSIPSSDIGVASVYFYGREVKFAGNREFAPWQITLIMDEPDFNKNTGVRGKFEYWSSLLNSHYTNVRSSGARSPSEYYGSAIVKPLSKVGRTKIFGATDIVFGAVPEESGTKLEEYSMIGCYPTDVGEIKLDWQDNNRIAEFTVTFEYQYWLNTAELAAVI